MLATQKEATSRFKQIPESSMCQIAVPLARQFQEMLAGGGAGGSMLESRRAQGLRELGHK